MRRINPRTTDKIATASLYIMSGFFVLLLASFVGYFLVTGGSKLNLHFLFSPPEVIKAGGGIGPQLFNSIYLVFLSNLISVPIGIATGIYMAEYAKPGRITKIIKFCIEALASLPSIVIGLFGLLVFVTLTGWKYTLFGGALAVSILNLPVITRTTEDAIRSVPLTTKEASLALGATHWQTIKKILVPCALPGIITGVIIASGRAFGEAAALLYTSGMSSPRLDFANWNPFSYTSPLNPFRPAETLAVYIWKVKAESLAPDAKEIANGASAVLILMVLFFNIAARFMSRRISAKFSGTRSEKKKIRGAAGGNNE
jgi:phosphate transport system permease protein